jgi:hypothetical protein
MNKLRLSPYFRFNQSDIDKFRAELLLLVKKLITLYSTRNEVNLLTQADEQELLSGTEAATDAMFAAMKSTKEETVDGKVATAVQEKVAAAVDENVAAAVDEKVSAAPCQEVITIGPTSDSVIRSMRESFYKIYSEHFETVREGGTSVMTRAMYDEKVQLKGIIPYDQSGEG